jgi:hypothetical protein
VFYNFKGTGQTAKFKTKKTNLKAMLRLLRTSDDGWFISDHIKEHNHPLTETCGQKQNGFPMVGLTSVHWI